MTFDVIIGGRRIYTPLTAALHRWIQKRCDELKGPNGQLFSSGQR
jgi:hypothetical protein